jgi:ribosomal protein S18 acetylase RimI-like enzyme
MNVMLRAATHEDYDAVCMLYAEVANFHAQALPQIFRPIEGPARSREFFERMIANENAAIFVAEQRDMLIGMIRSEVRTAPDVALFVPRHYVVIDDLIVGERFRHQGIGQALVERVHLWTRDKGLAEVELGVWEFNTSARMLYEKLGYQTTRRTMGKSV